MFAGSCQLANLPATGNRAASLPGGAFIWNMPSMMFISQGRNAEIIGADNKYYRAKLAGNVTGQMFFYPLDQRGPFLRRMRRRCNLETS